MHNTTASELLCSKALGVCYSGPAPAEGAGGGACIRWGQMWGSIKVVQLRKDSQEPAVWEVVHGCWSTQRESARTC